MSEIVMSYWISFECKEEYNFINLHEALYILLTKPMLIGSLQPTPVPVGLDPSWALN